MTSRNRTHKNRVQVRQLRDALVQMLSPDGPAEIEKAVSMPFADYIAALLDATANVNDGNTQESIIKMFAILPRDERTRLLRLMTAGWCAHCGVPSAPDTNFGTACVGCGALRV